MARVKHKKVRQLLDEKRSKITDRQFFTSRILAGHFEDIAAAQTRRYKYNRRIHVYLYWDPKDPNVACTDNFTIRINCGHKVVTKHRGRQNWLQFFTLHGKLGYDIILISQMDRMIDKQLRGLVEYEYVHRRLANFGWRGLLLRLFSLGGQFISVKVWYPMNEKLSQEIFRLSKKVYSIYDTHLLFDANGTEKVPKSNDSETKKADSVSE